MYKLVKKTFLNSLLLKNEQCSQINANLSVELKDLTFLYSQLKLKSNRLNYLLSNRCLGRNTFLLRTSKDREVLVSMDFKLQQLEVFDLENVDLYKNRELLIWWLKDMDEIYIKDIEGGQNKGHGSLGLSLLLDWCKENHIKRIYGFLVETDREHEDRLVHFYKKLGFEINFLKNSEGHNEYAMVEKYF